MTFELVTVRRKIRKQIQLFFSESPLLIIVYISVLLQYTAIKCASGSYTCSNLYILKLASPALTSCDAFLPGGSPVDAFPFIGLLPLVLFFQRHTSRIYKHFVVYIIRLNPILPSVPCK